MIISGNTTGFRKFYGQDDNFSFSCHINSKNTSNFRFGLTGQSNSLLFKIESGRFFDPSGRFVDSFPNSQYNSYKLEAKFKSGLYEYSLNNRIVSRENYFTGYYDSFVAQNNSSNGVDLDFYLSGNQPNVTFSGLWGLSGLSGRFINNGSYPITLFNVDSQENYPWSFTTGNVDAGKTGYFYFDTGFSYQTGTSTTLDFSFNFGDVSQLFYVYSGITQPATETAPTLTYLSNYSGQPPYVQNGATGIYRLFYNAPQNTNLSINLDYNIGRTGITSFVTGYPLTGFVANVWIFGNGGGSGTVTVYSPHARILRYVIDAENTGLFTGVSSVQTYNVPFRYFTGDIEYNLESAGVNPMTTTLPSGFSSLTDLGGYSQTAQLQGNYSVFTKSRQNHVLTGAITGQSQSGRYRFSSFTENISGAADIYSTISSYVTGNMSWTGYAVSGLAASLIPIQQVGTTIYTIPITGTDMAGRLVSGRVGGVLRKYIPDITYSGIYDFKNLTITGNRFPENVPFEQLSGIYFDWDDPTAVFSNQLNAVYAYGTNVPTYNLVDAQLHSFTGIVPDLFPTYAVGAIEYETLTDLQIPIPRTMCRYYFTTGQLSGFYIEKEKRPSYISSVDGVITEFDPPVNTHVFEPTLSTYPSFLAKRTVYMTGTTFTGFINVTGILQSGLVEEFLTTTVDYSGQAPFTKNIINVWAMATGSSPTGTFVDLAAQGKYSLASIFDSFTVSGKNELYMKIRYNGRGYADINGNVDMATLSVFGGYDNVVSLDITGKL